MSPGGSLPKILVISGWRGAGKTALCQRLAAQARQAGWAVAGLLSPARFAGGSTDPGDKTGIYVEDLRRGERRLLASNLPGELHGTRIGAWTFDDALFAWGNEVLRQSAGCDLLVIDELGPLEFDANLGWTEGFTVLEQGAYRWAVVVVRPECLEAFKRRWPGASVLRVEEGEMEPQIAQMNADFKNLLPQITQVQRRGNRRDQN